MTASGASDFDAALSDWRQALTADQVTTDPAALARASTATFATSARVSVILLPETTRQVVDVLRIASQHHVPVYPTSRGKNWGLGSRVPTVDGAALIDLGRMQRIDDFDDVLGLVRIEPGVSFAQLYEYLAERRSNHFLNVTGSSPDASVLANALERGDGAGPYGYRFDHVADMEVVLPTSEVIHTGFSRFGETPLEGLHRHGVGPSLDGLFSQSNLGIVTRLTLHLSPVPQALGIVRFRLEDAARLGPTLDALGQLRREGTVRANAALSNDYRVLSTWRQFPFEVGAPGELAPTNELARLRRELGATWFGVQAIYSASEAQLQANLARVKELLAPCVNHLEVDERSGRARVGTELFTEPFPAFLFLQGIPHRASLSSMYWRKPNPAGSTIDPESDRCGVLWLCPSIPFTGKHVTIAAELAERVMADHGFEPFLVFITPTERIAFCMPLVIYDRDVPGEDERAMACHDALLTSFRRSGYLPHRLGIQSMHALPAAVDDFDDVLARLRAILDPAGILAPGRYDFQPSPRSLR
ncbi:MAG: FAD-binding oxidoreductase [Polyangiaceae bacterium]